jgi:sugar phosphate isomerase/epimerase
MTSRRKFLLSSLAAVGGLALARPSLAEVFKSTSKVGIQLFTIPKLVSTDFKGTLTRLAKIGYKEVEFFGPYEFSAPETIENWKRFAGFLGVTQNAFYGYKPAEVKTLLADLGLSAPSAHLDITTLRKNLGPAAEGLSAVGVKYVVVPSLTTAEDFADYNKLADEFSSFGEQLATHGLTYVYHNHGYEHTPQNGKTLMDTLLTQTDEKVKFELDIFWMTAAGANPIEFLQKYPGRYKMMHVKNASEQVRFSGNGPMMEQIMGLMGKMADPGDGVFDIKAIIKAGKKSGVDHFFLERDMAPNPDTTLPNSYEYLAKVM